MLLVFSEHCNTSDYIRREITVAGEARKLVIPFRIEDVQPKRGLRIRLADLHWIDGFIAREQAIDAVVRSLSPGQKGSAPARGNQSPAPPRPTVPNGAGAEIVALLRSAEAGSAPSQFLLAARLRTGEGVNKVSGASYPLAQTRRGSGVRRKAQTNLGFAYERGEGIASDLAEAALWYRRAADQKHPRAQWSMGRLYDHGYGVAVDPALAAGWYTKAAEQGFVFAEFSLAQMLEDGRGLAQDMNRARALYETAAAKGYVEAAKALERLRRVGQT